MRWKGITLSAGGDFLDRRTKEHILGEKNIRTKDMGTEELIKMVIECAYEVRMRLAAGFLESVYQKAMLIELCQRGILADSEVPIHVYYRDNVVGEFRADILVENKIIVELKAVQRLNPIHESQLVNYLTATHKDHGLLINFGGERIEIRRKFREYKHRV